MRIHMTEIDGSLFEIEATLDDSTFLNIGPNAYDLCVNQGIHIYKGENGDHTNLYQILHFKNILEPVVSYDGKCGSGQIGKDIGNEPVSVK